LCEALSGRSTRVQGEGGGVDRNMYIQRAYSGGAPGAFPFSIKERGLREKTSLTRRSSGKKRKEKGTLPMG